VTLDGLNTDRLLHFFLYCFRHIRHIYSLYWSLFYIDFVCVLLVMMCVCRINNKYYITLHYYIITKFNQLTLSDGYERTFLCCELQIRAVFIIHNSVSFYYYWPFTRRIAAQAQPGAARRPRPVHITSHYRHQRRCVKRPPIGAMPPPLVLGVSR